jgi:uncharacterized membrane protein
MASSSYAPPPSSRAPLPLWGTLLVCLLALAFPVVLLVMGVILKVGREDPEKARRQREDIAAVLLSFGCLTLVLLLASACLMGAMDVCVKNLLLLFVSFGSSVANVVMGSLLLRKECTASFVSDVSSALIALSGTALCIQASLAGYNLYKLHRAGAALEGFGLHSFAKKSTVLIDDRRSFEMDTNPRFENATARDDDDIMDIHGADHAPPPPSHYPYPPTTVSSLKRMRPGGGRR